MKQLFSLSKHQRAFRLSIAIFLLFSFNAVPSYSINYFLNVGESITIDPPSAASGDGYIDQVHVLQTSSALNITENGGCSVTITVNTFFENTVTVWLRYVEKYYYAGHIGKVDHDVYVNITCKYVKPTSVTLPDVTVAVGGGVDIVPTIKPSDATITNSSWTKSGNCFNGGPREGHFYHVTGRIVGTGTVTVVLNDNINLTASCKVTVVDPDNMPPTYVSLPESKTISVGGSIRLTPQLLPENSSTTYKWSSDNESVATVDYGKVTGKSVGKANITVKTANGLTASCLVTVSSTGPYDDETGGTFSGSIDGYDYVDLGLSVKWASYNVGALNPEEFGDYYAWGETSEKSEYKWENYQYGTYMDVTSIGDDIKGTKFDVAHEKWSSNWRMPTEKEFRELYSNCTVKSTTKNSVEGYEFVGNNGASIFLPAAGYHTNSYYDGFRYWASNLSSTDPGKAASLLITENRYKEITASIQTQMRMTGMTVRPVTEATGSSSTKQQIILSASPSGGQVGKGTEVKLSTDVYGADIYYTLDGSTPSKSSNYYSSSITINENCTLKAIAYKEGYYSSDVLTEYYTVCTEINPNPTPIPDGSLEINATNFPDENFRQYLLEQDYGIDGVITEDELLQVIEIDIHFRGIKDIKGIEYFKALQILNCSSNELSSLDLSYNTSLSELNLHSNRQLESFDLSKNTKLKILTCTFMGLKALDVSNNIALEELNCDNNKLETIDVTNNVNLTILSCYHNQIRDNAMDNLINSLHINTTTTQCNFYVMGEGNKIVEEKNSLTDDQIANVYERGWIPYHAPNGVFVPYPNPLQTSISLLLNDINEASSIFDLSGKHLNKPRKGINIIEGKKVVVKW